MSRVEEMIKLLTQMLRLPLTVFVYSMEAFVNAIRDIERNTDRTINAMVGGVTQAPGNQSGKESNTEAPRVGGCGGISANQTTLKEDRKMPNQDLSGDDLKDVRYSILFTKRDLETPLKGETLDVVNYSTTGGSYGAIKIGDFLEEIAKNGADRPQVWKDNKYPPGVAGDKYFEIPSVDKKYITFQYTVDGHMPKGAKEYDKRTVEVLGEIKDSIDKVGEKIGP